MRRTFLLPAILLLASAGHAMEDEFSSLKTGDDKEWHIYPAVYGGYNQLINGYPGYKNLGNLGLQVLFHRVVQDFEPKWHTNRFLFSLAVDYMPLQVPESNYGLTEDLYAFTTQLIFNFQSDTRRWSPFIGVGLGTYLNRLTLDTPATGKVSGQHSMMGINASAGIFCPPGAHLRFAPEIRLHRLRGPDDYWPMNVTYHLGVIYGFQ